MKSLSRILKSPYVTMDNENKISIDVISSDVFKYIHSTRVGAEPETPAEQYEKARVICNQMIAEAEKRSKQIEEESMRISKSLREKAKEQGRQEGYNLGYNEGVSEADKIKQEAEEIRASAIQERKQILESIEPESVNLILGILRKLLTDSIQINPEIIVYLIKNGLSETSARGDIKIHVSEVDYDTVIAQKETFIALVDASVNIEIVKDFSLTKTDCVIETPFGNIDCSLNHQYNSLEKNLIYMFENR